MDAKRITVILKQYLELLYKRTFSQTFANFGSQRKVVKGIRVETHKIFYGKSILWTEKRKENFSNSFTNKKSKILRDLEVECHLEVERHLKKKLASFNLFLNK